MEEGNPNKDQDMYNFDKFRMISDTISEVIRWQKTKYNLLPIKEVQVSQNLHNITFPVSENIKMTHFFPFSVSGLY
jgi:hypothetical protein